MAVSVLVFYVGWRGGISNAVGGFFADLIRAFGAADIRCTFG